jgi:exopolyphosphatase/guanosine-5'-triphosphate,3'-diphosphate pyrophosphatase
MAELPTAPAASIQLAALDLGSNSFHLLVAQETPGGIQVLDKIKEMVRLAEGLDEQDRLSDPVAERALACLERFSQRLAGLERRNVRVVGTNTLRRAKNASSFLKKAEAVLGHPVEVISGHEEARLIYLGVAHSIEDNFDRRLVIDIGGGSTELILGLHSEAEQTESLYMGCVSMSKNHFGDGRLRAGQFKQAINAARQELTPFAKTFEHGNWDTAIGASGTILAIHEVLSQMGGEQSGITLAGLESIRKALVDAKHIDKISIPGLPAERAPVFPGGVAILLAAFKTLGIKTMQATSGALREGLLYDLLGRVQHHDVRENSIQDLCTRYHIDQHHARRVRELALGLLAQVAVDWELTDPNHQLLLGWAAQLHEIGMDISHTQYHKHSSYLLQNVDLAGFSTLDQRELAAIVRAHRRKFPTEEGAYTEQTTRLAVLLRIAVLLHRNRTSVALPHIAIRAAGNEVVLGFPKSWLKNHPLTRLDLAQEADYLASISIKLKTNANPARAGSIAG